jgi:UDP-glucose 4-epimerase
MLRGKRVVVTGGAGFIGSHLVERLARENEVVVLDDLSVGRLQNLAGLKERVEVVKGSILDPRATKKALAGADLAFHLAALTSVPESLENPLAYSKTNVGGTIEVLMAAQDAGVGRVVFASTCAIYGRDPPPLTEDSPPDPLSPYALSKLACEHIFRSLSGSVDPEIVSLRLFNVYGPRQSPDSAYASVIARFARAVLTGSPLPLHGDGLQTRDFVYVADVAEAFERAATTRAADGGVFNVGSGRETSILDLVETLRALAGTPLKVAREPARQSDVRKSRADVARARVVLKFEARTSLKEGLRRTLDAARLTSS